MRFRWNVGSRRFLAFVFDGLLVSAGAFVVLQVIAAFWARSADGGSSTGGFLIVAHLALAVLYFGVVAARPDRVTIGQALMRLRLIADPEGRRLWAVIPLRVVTKGVASALPLALGFSWLQYDNAEGQARAMAAMMSYPAAAVPKVAELIREAALLRMEVVGALLLSIALLCVLRGRAGTWALHDLATRIRVVSRSETIAE